MRSPYLLVFLLLLANYTYAQDSDTSAFIQQTERIELEVLNDEHNFTIIPGDRNGLMVIEEPNDFRTIGELWRLTTIDTALNVQWGQTIFANSGTYLKGYEYNRENYYLLFGKQQYKREELTVFRINAVSHDTTTFLINTVFPIDLEYFEIMGNTIIFGGYAYYKPVIMLFNMNDRLPKVLSGVYDNFSTILDVVPNDRLNIFSVIMSERLPNKHSTVAIKSFTSDGTPIQDRSLNPGEEKSLLDAASTSFLSGYQYVAGTYSQKKNDYSRGLYLARLKNGIQESILFHNYGDLENFFGHMSDRREKRVKERIKRRKNNGKRIRFNYRLAIHDIVEQENQYLMIGEAYYPRYRSSSGGFANPGYGNNFGGAFGSALPNSYNPLFLGYKYTHAVVVAFDKLGNILWDNSFEINDVMTPTLKKYVQVKVDPVSNKTILIYLWNNRIKTKIIDENDIVEGKTINPVKLTYEADKAKSADKQMEGLKDWYGNTLFAYGKQRIKNQENESVKGSRKIFYINKIQYEKNPALDYN
ncbi:MAG: hypothetical protein WBA74_16180 [Cyclobacteriaceae bacterium]